MVESFERGMTASDSRPSPIIANVGEETMPPCAIIGMVGMLTPTFPNPGIFIDPMPLILPIIPLIFSMIQLIGAFAMVFSDSKMFAKMPFTFSQAADH